MAFIQIIEFRTRRVEEFDALLDQWLAQSKDWRTATRSVRTKDRDRPDTYVQLVEFPSYEKAQENSDHPATAEFAERLSKLCDEPPGFRNLDVIGEEAL
jgi:quinol monooxygenase YgiN